MDFYDFFCICFNKVKKSFRKCATVENEECVAVQFDNGMVTCAN